MKTDLHFTDTQKAAIVSLIIEMVNIDKEIAPEEVHETNIINAELSITEEIFLTGRALDVTYALDIVRRLDDEHKLMVGQLLARIIDADTEVKDDEIALFNYICHATGIDILLEDITLNDEE